MCERIVIGFGFISDWMKKVARVFSSQSCSVVIQNQLLFDDDQEKTYSSIHYQNKSFSVFKHHKYLRVFGKRSTSEDIVKNHYSVDTIPDQNTPFTIIKNILIAVNNVNLC